ncbi:MAG TPA: GDP-L-fucose synthase family protein [Candidatus Wujingus californicus]|uniref:GDP-L-fucose synthase family protein n=1 Tax=Candidatus Wujingus californicus TaxID=3367618 RepID=UPI00402887DD
MNKDSKIYVAGHTGLLGFALLKRLELEGYQNIITKTRSELDLTNQKSVDEFFKKEQPEYVFLCAGLTGGIIANKTYPATFLHTNIAIQDNVFEAAQKYSVKHLIFYGSSCIYPKYSPQPIKEDYLFDGKIEETSDAYATAKIAGIIACKSYNIQFNTRKFIALVPNTMFGPYDNFDPNTSHVIPSLIRKFHEAKECRKEKVVLWGSGNPRREFIFSKDVADASLFAVKNAEKLQNMHYNVGTGIDYSIRELAEIVAEIVGFEGEIGWDVSKTDGAQRKLLDSLRFLDLGWKPLTPLKEGLKITYEWFLKNNA